MALKVYNTLTRKKEIFKPRKNKLVNMFVCGPTVYDVAHIGHARSYIVFDVIAKYIRYKGYKVTYIQNITDIDDKIINRAKTVNEEPSHLAKEFEQTYYEDMSALNVNAVDKYLLASQHLPEIISQIQRLVKKGYAYVAKDGVWFKISEFKDYGKLSRQKPEELQKHRIELSPYKKTPADFALWKKQKPGEPAWDSPWGKGRPGWHIEDTAITEKYFGPQYDVHGGGMDLIFPHHEAEIAQMEAVSGKKPLVKYWLHNGFLLVNGEKMSKSLGNYITVRDALKEYSPQVLRFFFALTHYRNPIDYSEAALENAKNSYNKFEEFILRLKKHKNGKSNGKTKLLIEQLNENFESAMDDDFNVAGAMAHIFEFISKINKLLDNNEPEAKNAKAILDALYAIDEVLGFNLKEIKEGQISKDVALLIKKREVARKKKDFKTADKVRFDLAKKGIILEDQPDGGTRWKITQTH
jgi:cysteinyl-tRNA synthetase